MPHIQFLQQTAEIWPRNQILIFKKVPRGIVGLEVRVPPYSRVLWQGEPFFLFLSILKNSSFLHQKLD